MTEYEESFEQFSIAEPELAGKLESVRTLEHVLQWMKQEALPLADVEIIAQDEYSLDFVLPLPDERFLVWGIT